MRSSTGSTVLITLALALLVLVGGGLAFIYSGVYNVAATDSHLGIMQWALNTTMDRSVAVHASEAPEPPPVDSAMLANGFHHFSEMCVTCHGAPGVERGEIGKGMNPEPPELSEEAAEFSPRELFWITKHGIKMAGMPAFGPTHTDEEIWGIVSYVQRLPEMSPEEYQGWVGRYGGGGGEGADGEEAEEGGHAHAPGTPPHSH